jgi:hypothetical protein
LLHFALAAVECLTARSVELTCLANSLRSSSEVEPPHSSVEPGGVRGPQGIGHEGDGGARVDLVRVVGEGVHGRGEQEDVEQSGADLLGAEEEGSPGHVEAEGEPVQLECHIGVVVKGGEGWGAVDILLRSRWQVRVSVVVVDPRIVEKVLTWRMYELMPMPK